MSTTIYFNKKRVIFDKLMDSNYTEHLNSPEWEEFRSDLRNRAKQVCELCSAYIGNRGVIHHISYDDLFEETGKNEVYLCRNCHEESHQNG